MSVLDNVLPADINGVQFLWKAVETTGGRKTIKHEYPGSTNRFVEDVGGSLDVYTVRGIVTGVDYLQQKENIRRELSADKQSILSHPYDGAIEGRIIDGFTISEDQAKIGVVNFSFTFAVTRNRSTQPLPAQTNTAEVANIAAEAEAAAVANLSENFGVERNNSDNFNDARSILEDTADVFESSIVGANTVITELNQYVSDVERFSREIVSLISDPIELAASIENLFDRASNMIENPIDRLDYIKSFYGFGDDFVEFPVTTANRQERKKNRDVLKVQMQAIALTKSYADAVLVEYDTVDDLDAVANTIEEQYQAFSELDELDEDTDQQMANLRAKFRDFVDQARLTAPKVGQITIAEMPVNILAFNEYGSTDDAEKIYNLNDQPDASLISGEVNILTA